MKRNPAARTVTRKMKAFLRFNSSRNNLLFLLPHSSQLSMHPSGYYF
jgi:hypothetical protein